MHYKRLMLLSLSCIILSSVPCAAANTASPNSTKTEETTMAQEAAVTTTESTSDTTTEKAPITTETVKKEAKKEKKTKKKVVNHQKKKRKVKKIEKQKVKEKQVHSKIQPKKGKKYDSLSLKIKNHKEYIDSYIYLNQGDEAWNQSGYSIHSSGCGPTAISTCIVNLTKKWITPVDVAAWGYDHGYYSGSGSTHEGIPAMVKHFGLRCNGLNNRYSGIKEALQTKKLVIGLMGPGYFTKGGHFIVLLNIDDKDQVTIADVGSRQRSQHKYPLKDVINESKSAGGGGPFWSVEASTIRHSKKRISVLSTKKRTSKENIKKKVVEFYQNASDSMNDFEKQIPGNIIYIGKQKQRTEVTKKNLSKINQNIYNLGVKLDDQKLIQISKNYDFGVDQISMNNGKVFDLKQYLEKKINEGA